MAGGSGKLDNTRKLMKSRRQVMKLYQVTSNIRQPLLAWAPSRSKSWVREGFKIKKIANFRTLAELAMTPPTPRPYETW